MQFVVTTFYKIFSLSLADAEMLREKIRSYMQDLNIKGTILLGANEGINATISGPRDAINQFYQFVNGVNIIADIEFKESFCDFIPFEKIKVKIKKEIVTLKSDKDFDFTGTKGKYIAPDNWDEFIARDDVIVIDSRNDYEYHVGTFNNAINPNIENFRDIAAWLEQNKELYKDKKIATFCTGGIRCEKLTAMMSQADKNLEVYHLQGGILGYFMKTGNENKKWNGHCFVFDNRIAIDDKLQPI